MDDNQPAPLGPVTKACAAVTGKDPNILAKCPMLERTETVHDGIAVGLLGTFELLLWTFALTAFGWPVPAAIPVALLISAIIVMLDIRLASSDNAPRGVLARGGRSFLGPLMGRLLSRLVLAVFLSLVPAGGAHIAIFRPEAITAMEAERNSRNAIIIAETEQEIAALRAQRLGRIDAVGDQLVSERDSLLAAQRSTRNTIESALDDKREADLERSRQIRGYGDREEGNGVLAQDAEFRAQQAVEHAREARQEVDQIAARVDEIDADIARNDELRSGLLSELEPEIARLLEERDARLEQRAEGIVTAALGIRKLHEDPEQSAVMWGLTLLIYLGTLAIELSFFLRVSVFKPASVYDAILTIERQQYVAHASHEFARNLSAMREERPPLRIIARARDANS